MSSPLSRRTRVLAGSALTVAAVAAATFFAAGPASAATLPNGESIITIGWNGILQATDPATGVVTPVADTGIEAITGLDVDNAGKGYAVSYDADPSVLYTADVVAGTLSNPVDITIDGETNVADCTGLDYAASGVIVAACDGPEYSVGTIDPATGIFSTAITFDNQQRVAALATDPVTGVHYGFTYSGQVLDLDLEAGTFEVVGAVDADIYGADFDSNGVLWAVGYVDGQHSLLSAQTSDWALTVEAALDQNDFTEALTVWNQNVVPPVVPVVPVAPEVPADPAAVAPPVATLANTGLDAGPLALIAGLTMLAGSAAIAVRRRSASRG